MQKVLQRLLSSIGSLGSPQGFTAPEEAQLCDLLQQQGEGGSGSSGSSAPSPAHTVRVVLEGCAYLLETAAFHNLKTAAFGQALLQAGLREEQAVVFGNAWTAGSAAVVTRLKSRPLGSPLVLQGSSYRVALSLGSTAGTDTRETTAVLDLELADVLGEQGAPTDLKREVLSIELGREGMADLLAKLDAIQTQMDSLTS